MRKHLAFALAGLMVAATAATGVAAEYDRYDRGPRGGRPGDMYAPPPPPPPPGRAAAPARPGSTRQPYLFGHMGVFEPNNYSDNYNGIATGYDSRDTAPVQRQHRLRRPPEPVRSPSKARSVASRRERGSSSNKAIVVPVTIGGRLILPNPCLEPYLGGGMGIYFASLKEDSITFTRTRVYSGIDDSSTDFGGYLSAGLDMWLNPRTALNFEGKYHLVQPDLPDQRGERIRREHERVDVQPRRPGRLLRHGGERKSRPGSSSSEDPGHTPCRRARWGRGSPPGASGRRTAFPTPSTSARTPVSASSSSRGTARRGTRRPRRT